MIGRDLAAQRTPTQSAWIIPLMLLALMASLGVAALRIDLLRSQYALAEHIAEERELLEEQRTLTAQMRQLHDPVRLSRRAEALGFDRPEHLIDLPGAGAEAQQMEQPVGLFREASKAEDRPRSGVPAVLAAASDVGGGGR